jgi:hypothetical protein
MYMFQKPGPSDGLPLGAEVIIYTLQNPDFVNTESENACLSEPDQHRPGADFRFEQNTFSLTVFNLITYSSHTFHNYTCIFLIGTLQHPDFEIARLLG